MGASCRMGATLSALASLLLLIHHSCHGLEWSEWFSKIQQRPLKVYIYDLPEQFIRSEGTFTVRFTNLLKQSQYYTTDGDSADMYYIPSRGWFENQTFLLSMYDWVRTAHPWWNRTVGKTPVRHFIFMQNDHGPGDAAYERPIRHPSVTGCPEDVNPANPNRSISFLQWNGLRDGADWVEYAVKSTESDWSQCLVCFQYGKDIMVPTGENVCGPTCGYSRHRLKNSGLWGHNQYLRSEEYKRHRKYLMIYGGVIPYPELNDYTGRGQVWRLYANRSEYSVVRRGDPTAWEPHLADFSLLMQESDFCYSPLGQHGGDTDRYIAGLMFGCVPVLPGTTRFVEVKKAYIPHALPLEELLPWHEFGTYIDYQHVDLLDQQLRCLRPRLERMRQHMEMVYPHFLWTSIYGSYFGESTTTDAFESIMAVYKLRLMQAAGDPLAGKDRPFPLLPKSMRERNQMFPCRDKGLPDPPPY